MGGVVSAIIARFITSHCGVSNFGFYWIGVIKSVPARYLGERLC